MVLFIILIFFKNKWNYKETNIINFQEKYSVYLKSTFVFYDGFVFLV